MQSIANTLSANAFNHTRPQTYLSQDKKSPQTGPKREYHYEVQAIEPCLSRI